MFILNLHGLLSLLILMIRHVDADGQLYVSILCVFLLTMPVKYNTIYFDMLPMAIGIYINYRY